MTGSPISLRIAGDPAALEALADALDRTLLTELRRSEDGLASNELNFQPSWRGDAADAFFAASAKLGKHISAEVSDYIASAAEVIRAYAWRLARARELFQSYAVSAAEHGLIVAGDVILPPTVRDQSNPDAPCLTTDVDPTVLDLKYQPIAMFNEITEKVGEWHGEHRVWILTHFGPLLAYSEGASGLNRFLEHFEVSEFSLFSAAVDLVTVKVDSKLSALRENSALYSAGSEALDRARHGANYQLRAAEEAVTGRELRKGMTQIEWSLVEWRKTGDLLKVAGPGAAVADVAVEVLDGEPYGRIAAGAGGAGIAGLAAARGMRGGNPVVAVGVVAVASVLGSGVSKSAWDASGRPAEGHLSLGTSEKILSWLGQPGKLETGEPRMG